MAALVASLDDRSVASWANRSKLLLFIGCVVSQGGGGDNRRGGQMGVLAKGGDLIVPCNIPALV